MSRAPYVVNLLKHQPTETTHVAFLSVPYYKGVNSKYSLIYTDVCYIGFAL